MFIDRDPVIAVVEGLHPVIIDLKIPGLALGYALESNAEGLVRLKSEVSMPSSAYLFINSTASAESISNSIIWAYVMVVADSEHVATDNTAENLGA